MFRRIHWSTYLGFALPAALVYCIPAFIFIKQATFSQSWLLYLGNLLFLLVIMAFLFFFNKRRDENASAVTMLVAGHITTILGVLISCLVCGILLAVLVPPGKVLAETPANAALDRTNGLNFYVLADSIIGNFSTGSFISIVFPFALKREQRSERVPRKHAEL